MASESLSGRSVAASVAAAVAARSLAHPLDTLRVRRVVGRPATRRRGELMRGWRPALAMTVPGTSVYLLCYSHVLARARRHWGPESVAAVLVASLAAEAAAGVIFTPFEIVRQRQQAEVDSRGALRQAWTLRGRCVDALWTFLSSIILCV